MKKRQANKKKAAKKTAKPVKKIAKKYGKKAIKTVKKQVKKQKAKKTAPKTAKPSREIKSLMSPPLLEEIILNCANCGRQIRMIKVSQYNPVGILCQTCSKGELEFPTD